MRAFGGRTRKRTNAEDLVSLSIQYGKRTRREIAKFNSDYKDKRKKVNRDRLSDSYILYIYMPIY